ncbi:somatostatin 1.2 isoform X1 [Phyllopteryx taeniolatus]|uniref:somatostatin 1.2 isoform X1 n=1 Tax=Phyllopteryx taeniolatus TaxID=161469 RepID=UPI002AD3C740|nr:somatostatin 1.2 isoform X1 [Phyllopteryx taeniolatus]
MSSPVARPRSVVLEAKSERADLGALDLFQRRASGYVGRRMMRMELPGKRARARPKRRLTAMRGCERSLVPLVTCLLVCSLAVSSQPDRQQDLDLDLDRELELRHLKMPHQLGHGQRDLLQDWTKRAVEDLLARLSPPEAEIRQPSDLASARMDGERSVDPPNNGPPRERKAGCKNFYWKGFTSC